MDEIQSTSSWTRPGRVHALASALTPQLHRGLRTETCTVTDGFRASVESAGADQYDCLTKRAVGRLLAFAPSSGDIKLVSFIRVSDDGHRLTDTEVLLHEDDFGAIRELCLSNAHGKDRFLTVLCLSSSSARPPGNWLVPLVTAASTVSAHKPDYFTTTGDYATTTGFLLAPSIMTDAIAEAT